MLFKTIKRNLVLNGLNTPVKEIKVFSRTLLVYGIKVKPEHGKNNLTKWFLLFPVRKMFGTMSYTEWRGLSYSTTASGGMYLNVFNLTPWILKKTSKT